MNYVADKIFDTAMNLVKWGGVMILAGLVLAVVAVLIKIYSQK